MTRLAKRTNTQRELKQLEFKWKIYAELARRIGLRGPQDEDDLDDLDACVGLANALRLLSVMPVDQNSMKSVN